MPATEQLELRRRRLIAGLAVVLGHHRAVLAHFLLVLHILLREAEWLLEQEQRGDGVGGEGETRELLAHLRQAVGLRNPYVDALSFLQVRFLTDLRNGLSGAEAARAAGLVLLTVNGVAAGLQNTG